MSRVVIIGNAGAGKSTLARRLSQRLAIPHVEIDRYLWQPGWIPTAEAEYEKRHSQIILEQQWIIDGLGRQVSIAARIERATEIILVDMPLWMHFWLAAERQVQWSQGLLHEAPGGLAEMPPTRALFETMWNVEQSWMPDIRRLCSKAEQEAKPVVRVTNVDELNLFES